MIKWEKSKKVLVILAAMAALALSAANNVPWN
jgi:hypothetical protein